MDRNYISAAKTEIVNNWLLSFGNGQVSNECVFRESFYDNKLLLLKSRENKCIFT